MNQKNKIKKIDAETVRRHLLYNPRTGVFTWKWHKIKKYIGREAGCLNNRGYTCITIAKKIYTAHRLAFVYMTGKMPLTQVDHIDGVRNNNKWENLRISDHSTNQMNSRLRCTNTSGYKGVSWDNSNKQYVVRIKKNYKSYFLGNFDDAAEGYKAYVKAAKELFGEYAYTQNKHTEYINNERQQ